MTQQIEYRARTVLELASRRHVIETGLAFLIALDEVRTDPIGAAWTDGRTLRAMKDLAPASAAADLPILVPGCLADAAPWASHQRQFISMLVDARFEEQACQAGQRGLPPAGGEGARALSAALDRILLSEVRERWALVAIEEERARFARDLHDSPLQELAGVIKQLERRRETAGEVEKLRNVAAELRGMALELRPAVLEDLGLAASLLALAEEPNEAGAVATRFRNDTGYGRQQRLPPEVELVAYRVVAETVSNARTHSGARTVYIDGVVSPRYLDLTVSDDGCGFDQTAVRRAEQLGHFGLATMHQRAHIVGASLSVDAEPGRGTTVHLAWRSR